MLIVSRRPSSSRDDPESEIVLTIPASTEARVVVVKLLDIDSRYRARIGIHAAEDVRINRREVQDVVDAALREDPAP